MTGFDWLSQPAVLVGCLAATAAFAALFTKFHAPERLASAWGYPGPLRMFALDTSRDSAASRTLLATYGEVGRRQVILAHLIFDFAFPIVYTGSLLGFLASVGLHFPQFLRPWAVMRILPLGAGMADVLENLGIIAMAAAYPRALKPLSWVTTAFTTIKFSFLVVSGVLLVIGIGVDLWFGIFR